MQMGKILKEHIDNGCEKVLYLHEYLVEEGANVDYPEEFSNSGVLLTHYWITKKVPKNVEDLKKEIAEAVADYELYCKKNNIVVRTAKDSVVEITDQMNLKSLKI